MLCHLDSRLTNTTGGDMSIIEKSATELADDEVRIQVRACGLNFRDVLNAMNLYPGDPGPLGGDVCGEIIAVGQQVQDFALGDRVMGLAPGCLASLAFTKAS